MLLAVYLTRDGTAPKWCILLQNITNNVANNNQDFHVNILSTQRSKNEHKYKPVLQHCCTWEIWELQQCVRHACPMWMHCHTASWEDAFHRHQCCRRTESASRVTALPRTPLVQKAVPETAGLDRNLGCWFYPGSLSVAARPRPWPASPRSRPNTTVFSVLFFTSYIWLIALRDMLDIWVNYMFWLNFRTMVLLSVYQDREW